MEKGFLLRAKTLRNIAIIVALLLLCFLFWPQVQLAVQLVLGGWVIAFLLEPIVGWFSLHMKRMIAVACTFGIVAAALVGAVLLLVPPMTRQVRELIGAIPSTMKSLEGFMQRVNVWLADRNLMALKWPAFDFSTLSGGLEKVMSGTVSWAGSMVNGVTRFGLTLILSAYFLFDRDKLLLKMELFIPSASRRLVLKMAAGIKRELRLYIRGQMTIALIVGVLATLGLAIIGAPSYLVLGLIIAVCNMIPYFGPIIGGIPAVLMALSQGLPMLLWTCAVLFVVQQLDGFLISPRVMSGITGLSPPAVLIAITVGSSLAGILGMVFALPILLCGKICLRIWASRNEMIEKFAEM